MVLHGVIEFGEGPGIASGKVALGLLHAEVFKGVQAADIRAVGGFFQPLEEGFVHPFPGQARPLLENGVPHLFGVLALPACHQKGAAGVIQIPAVKAAVDEAFFVQAVV